MEQEYTYWMALAHTERMRTAQKNEIIVQCYERSIGLSDFFHCGEAVWQKDFQLTPEEIGWLNESKKGLPNYAFEAESLLEQGYSLIPILSSDYPKTLKQNLKKTYAPPLLYAKGNLQLLKTDSIAIVGSRQAESASLQFTDNIAKQAAVQKKAAQPGLFLRHPGRDLSEDPGGLPWNGTVKFSPTWVLPSAPARSPWATRPSASAKSPSFC